MRWEPDARELYEEVIRNIAQPIKLIAAPPIRRAAERGAIDRGGTEVTRIDLVDGIFDVVPQAYRARVVANLTSLGIDCSNYLNVSVRKFLAGTDLKQLWDKLLSAARQTGIIVDEVKTRAVLEAYSQYFRKSHVSLRYLEVPDEVPSLSARYLETVGAHTPDPLTTAVIRGFVDENGSPMFDFFEDMKFQCDVLGYGVDLDVVKGINKFRAVIAPVPIEYLLMLSRLPESVKSSIAVLKSHGMSRISMLGFDFERELLNLYVMVRDSAKVAPAKQLDLLNELHMPVSPALLGHTGESKIVSFSFAWTSEQVQRVTYTSLHSETASMPSWVDPLVLKNLKKVGFCENKDSCLLGMSVSANQSWFGIECDFEGALSKEVLRAAVAGV